MRRIAAATPPFAGHFPPGVGILLPMALAAGVAGVGDGLTQSTPDAVWCGAMGFIGGFPSGVSGDTVGPQDLPVAYVENSGATGRHDSRRTGGSSGSG